MNDEKAAWGDKKTLRRLFSVPVRKLDALVADGLIRTCKFGSCQQSARLYRIGDLEDALLALSEGREPRRPAVRRATAR